MEIIKVALIGNPNSGKTSLFNALAGTNLKVGNFTGVTVEKAEKIVKYSKDISIKFIDLPGIYSLTTYSPEELLARNYLFDENPDIIINILDGTNIERNLYLTTQLMELGQNMFIAVNMIDQVKKQNTQINYFQLQKLLGTHVIPVSAKKNIGLDVLQDNIVNMYKNAEKNSKNKLVYREDTENIIKDLTDLLKTEKNLKYKFSFKWLSIKLLENDKYVYNYIKEYPIWTKISGYLQDKLPKHEIKYKTDIEETIAEDRYAFARGAVKETVIFGDEKKESLTDKIDKILLNRYIGLPIFMLFMWLIFYLTFTVGNYPMEAIENFFGWLSTSVSKILPDGNIKSLIVDGIISGVGGVLVFLPNIIILFLFLALMEGSGYISRSAFVIDKVMHTVGLHGKSFIPMLSGFGCSVPAFMSTRTLKNRSDKITTMLIIPFMSCGAKIPVYVLIASAFFAPNVATNVIFGVYLFGILIAFLSAKIFKIFIFKKESEPFVMELPPYRNPTIKFLLIQMWAKAYTYLRKAATVILMASVIIWLATNFPKSTKISENFSEKTEKIRTDNSLSDKDKRVIIEDLENKEKMMQQEYSIVGKIGKFIEPAIKPLGFDWRIGVGLTTGLAAKEVFVSTMGTIFALGDEVDEKNQSLSQKLRKAYDLPTALSLMIFVLLYIPCLAATIVFHKEIQNWYWTLFYMGYSMGIAWIFSFIVYNIAKLFS